MQITHNVIDLNYTYPQDLKVKDVNVYMHPSEMFMTHDYSCPVCRNNHAVITDGLMQPCYECQNGGYKLIKVSKKEAWYKKYL